jgi:multicomponent Na+:H+ antiporter subunit D
MNLFPRKLMQYTSFICLGFLSLSQIYLVLARPQWFWYKKSGLWESLFSFRYTVDEIALVLLLCIGIVVFISLLTARAMIPEVRQRVNFKNLLLVSFIGMNATALVKDIFSLYVFIEITAVSSYIMIAMNKNDTALEGAFKYLILSAIATVMMLAAVSLILLLTGNTSFAAVSTGLSVAGQSLFVRIAIGLFLCGLFIKSGLVPFHAWLPDAYSAAPAPVSILLAGIVTKASGVYALIRLAISVFGLHSSLQSLLMFIGAVSILVGAIAALTQTDFKRMLAYSSISQVGYIVLGLGCATPLAIFGAVFHLFNHAIFKSLLFVNAASVEKELGTTDMEKMGGLAQKMPVAGVSSVVGLLSTAGIPPLSGFWSKFIIILALWQAGRFGYAFIAVLASLLTLAYFLAMQRRVFFGKLRGGLENIRESSISLIISQSILVLITVGLGVFFPLVIKWR